MTKEELLKKYWNYDHFKPHQESIITSVIQGNDTLALLPTGGGKSLCYQLPALLLEGVTLIISPLIALMEDQVQQLNSKGIKAMYIASGKKSQSLSKQLDNCIYGNFKCVYVSPERLQNEEFIERIKTVNINLIAVDEAHCISEWGHDFRPAYRKINHIRSYFPGVPLLALTASATPKVVADIQENLALKETQFFKASFERKNLNYQIIHTEDKIGAIEKILKNNDGTSIIYCRTRNETEQLSALLQQKKIAASFFHGGMETPDKKERLNAWQTGKTKVMIATTAFGMGIDKADVRTVIHLSMPESLESYYQETGRAGRDGLTSTVSLLVQEGDFQQLRHQFIRSLPDKKAIKKCYKHLCNYLQIAYGEGKDQFFHFNFKHFCNAYELSPKKTLNCLNIFDREGIFRLHLSLKKEIKISSTASREVVLNYLEINRAENDILHYFLRNYQDFLQQNSLRIDLQKIKKNLKQSEEVLLDKLNKLQENNIIKIENNAQDVQLFGLVPREDQYSLNSILSKVKEINAIKTDKIEQIISFTKDEKQCKRNVLLRYFGEIKKQPCGKCSAKECQQQRPKALNLEANILSHLKDAPKTAHELKKLVAFDQDDLTAALYRLQEMNKIKRLDNQAFTIIN